MSKDAMISWDAGLKLKNMLSHIITLPLISHFWYVGALSIFIDILVCVPHQSDLHYWFFFFLVLEIGFCFCCLSEFKLNPAFVPQTYRCSEGSAELWHTGRKKARKASGFPELCAYTIVFLCNFLTIGPLSYLYCASAISVGVHDAL